MPTPPELQKQEIKQVAKPGTFPKGVSGNPKGRPRKADRERMSQSELLRLAEETIEDLLRTGSEGTKAKLAMYVRDHALGKAPQRVIQEPPAPLEQESPQPVALLDSKALEAASA